MATKAAAVTNPGAKALPKSDKNSSNMTAHPSIEWPAKASCGLGLRPSSPTQKYRLFEVQQVKDTPACRGLTQAFLTANSCINMSGFGSQTLIARVEHAGGQIAQGTLPVPTRTVFAVAEIVDWGQQEAPRTEPGRTRAEQVSGSLVRRQQPQSLKSVIDQGHLPLLPVGGGAGPAPVIPVQ